MSGTDPPDGPESLRQAIPLPRAAQVGRVPNLLLTAHIGLGGCPVPQGPWGWVGLRPGSRTALFVIVLVFIFLVVHAVLVVLLFTGRAGRVGAPGWGERGSQVVRRRPV